MALKDWKKKKGIRNQVIFIRKERISGISGVIAIQEIPQFEGKPFYIFVTSKSGTRKKFKTKAQALLFAKNYMRLH